MRGTFSWSHASQSEDGKRDVDEQRPARSEMGERLQRVWAHMGPDVSNVGKTGKRRLRFNTWSSFVLFG